jgi:aerobic carbon-monoxide dehydrogenase small subunit
MAKIGVVAPQTITITLNGKKKTFPVNPADTLLDFLRETARMTGAKEGCGKGECGACTVWFDGEPVNSCLVMAVQADGHEITTVEGLAAVGKFHPVQKAMLECGGAQCGICTPGFIMSAAALLRETLDPTDAEIRTALEGNLCRCTGYHKIFASVKQAAAEMREGAGASSVTGAAGGQ